MKTDPDRVFADALPPGVPLSGPLYAEVKRRIVRGLRDGDWALGAPLPSEAELAARYAVSVGTVRKALGELTAERLLVRRPGRGTFAANHSRDSMLDAFFHIVDDRGGKAFPESRMLSFRRQKADVHTAARLGVGRDSPVFQIENLLYLQGRPTIYDRIRVPRLLFPALDAAAFRDRDMTIFAFYQSRFGVTVTRVEEWVRAASADARAARELGVERGAAVLAIERVAYTYEGQPVEVRDRRVSTRSHAYLNVLGGRR